MNNISSISNTGKYDGQLFILFTSGISSENKAVVIFNCSSSENHISSLHNQYSSNNLTKIELHSAGISSNISNGNISDSLSSYNQIESVFTSEYSSCKSYSSAVVSTQYNTSISKTNSTNCNVRTSSNSNSSVIGEFYASGISSVSFDLSSISHSFCSNSSISSIGNVSVSNIYSGGLIALQMSNSSLSFSNSHGNTIFSLGNSSYSGGIVAYQEKNSHVLSSLSSITNNIYSSNHSGYCAGYQGGSIEVFFYFY